MSEAFLKGVAVFAEKTGIGGKICPRETDIRIALTAVGVLLVLFGIGIYRLLTAVLLFGVLAAVLVSVLDGKIGWGAVVTAFVLIGCLFACFSFLWKTADAMVIGAMVLAYVGWSVYPAWWTVLIGAAVGFLVTGLFPLYGVTAFCAAMGTILLMEQAIFFQKIPGTPTLPWIPAVIVHCFGFAGFCFQLFVLGRKQKLFKKTMPDRIRYLLERNRAVKTGEKKQC